MPASLDIQTLVNRIISCASCVFATTMFGKPEHINFDHDIVYYIPPPNACYPTETMCIPPPEVGPPCDDTSELWNPELNCCAYRKYENAPFEIRDLLNIDYPTSLITNVEEGRHTYRFGLTAARLIDEQDDSDSDLKKFKDLEDKMWKILQCMNTCDAIVEDGVTVTRDKGTFNDKLITVNFNFEIDIYATCLEPAC